MTLLHLGLTNNSTIQQVKFHDTELSSDKHKGNEQLWNTIPVTVNGTITTNDGLLLWLLK